MQVYDWFGFVVCRSFIMCVSVLAVCVFVLVVAFCGLFGLVLSGLVVLLFCLVVLG